jgi:hypothetical protein
MNRFYGLTIWNPGIKKTQFDNPVHGIEGIAVTLSLIWPSSLD